MKIVSPDYYIEDIMGNIIGKIKNFKPEKAEITLQIMFLNENLIVDLIKSEGKVIKFNYIETRYKESTKDSSRKRWFQVISHILKSQEIEITKEVLNAFHETMKESFFDCEKFIVDGKEIVIVPSINSVPEEQVKNAIDAMIARYSQIGVDFSTIL
jgi:hypothetical protein